MVATDNEQNESTPYVTEEEPNSSNAANVLPENHRSLISPQGQDIPGGSGSGGSAVNMNNETHDDFGEPDDYREEYDCGRSNDDDDDDNEQGEIEVEVEGGAVQSNSSQIVPQMYSTLLTLLQKIRSLLAQGDGGTIDSMFVATVKRKRIAVRYVPPSECVQRRTLVIFLELPEESPKMSRL